MASKQTILTLEEAVEKVLQCAESEETDIVILPPEQGDTYATDLEEDDEDICHRGDSLPNDVAGTLEVHKKDEGAENEKTVFESITDARPSSSVCQTPQPKKKIETVYWKKTTNLKKLEESEFEQLSESHPHLLFLEPVELFRLFVNNEICEMIRCETERYAAQKNQPMNISAQEIEMFLAIVILTGYNSRPRQRLYWSKDDDVTCSVVSRSMARKQFEDIKRYLHFVDNNHLQIGEKLAKIRPLQDKENRSLQQFGVFSKDLSIDEQMVPYFGRHSSKMFIRGKPIRFGYKNWVLASSCGYPYKFETYTGASKSKDSSKPLGPQVVCSLLSVVKNPTCHRICFDNFFTSYFLLRYLHEHKFRALGTIREKRTMKCPLRSSKVVLKEKRGFTIIGQMITFLLFNGKTTKLYTLLPIS